jgi:hypothetical protein
MVSVAVSDEADVGRRVSAEVNYVAPMSVRPRFHANDKSRDVLDLDTRRVEITDARTLRQPPTLAAEGLMLVHAPTRMRDFRDRDEVASVYAREVHDIVKRETGAELVLNMGAGVLRFSERSGKAGSLNNSFPARFVHNDVSEATARAFAARALPGGAAELAGYRSFAQYNVWRAFSPPPQDVPLAMLDARTLAASELVEADAVFDETDKPEWSFEGWLVRPGTRHRWLYFSNMGASDALLFTTFGYRDGRRVCVPHTGFDAPDCPAGCAPRASIEMRAIAFFR